MPELWNVIIRLNPRDEPRGKMQHVFRCFVLAGLLCGLFFRPLGSAVQPGEGNSLRLYYDAKKMGLTVLHFSLFIERQDPGFCVTASFRTTGIARPFIRMDNVHRSIVKEGTLEPVTYERFIDKKRFLAKAERYNEIIYFRPEESKIFAVRDDPLQTREESVPPQARDPLAMFLKYYLGPDIRDGDQATLLIYDGKDLRTMFFSAAGEEISTPLFGRIRTMCVKAKTIFKTFGNQEGTFKAWYTTDGRRLPVQIEIDPPSAGSIRLVLVKVEMR